MDKIVTLTMNPSLDVSTRVGTVAPEIKLRCEQPTFDPGGGGINVSRAIRFLGGDSVAVLTSGGHTGTMLEALLAREDITTHAVAISGLTREGFAVYEASSTLQFRFNMPGPELDANEWINAIEQVFELSPQYIVASGSLPPGVPDEFYGELTRYANSYGIRVIVDTSGKALHKSFNNGVYMLKPNLQELEAFAGEDVQGEDHLKQIARRLIGDGMTEVMVVSMGAAGAAVITASEYAHMRAPLVKVQSKVGAGDSMVGGIVMGLAQGRDLIDAVRWGIAAGTAAVMTPGTELCRLADAEQLYQQISVTQ
jgi:6-phosphofructokinase 2